MKTNIKSNNGFTLIELIAVFLIVSILSAYFVTRKMDTNADLIGEFEIVKSYMRYVQYLALINDTDSWKLEFTETSYTLVKNNSTDTPPNLPNENSPAHQLPLDPEITISIQNSVGNVNEISFDKWGSPVNGLHKITLLKTSNGLSKSFNVIKNTGAVYDSI